MNQAIRVTEGWAHWKDSNAGLGCRKNTGARGNSAFLATEDRTGEMTYEPPHLTWQGRAGTAQLDESLPAARPTIPGAAHALWQYPTPLSLRQRREK